MPPTSGLLSTAVLEQAPTGIAADLTFRVEKPAVGVVVAATAVGISEGPSGVYSIEYTEPALPGVYVRVWKRVSSSLEITETIEVGPAIATTAAPTATPSVDTRSIERGDSYTGARALQITDPAWPVLTGGTVRYVAPMGTRGLNVPAAVTAARVVQLDLTAAVTDAMAPALYEGELHAQLADGSSVTLGALNLDARE